MRWAEDMRNHGMRMHACNVGKGWTGSRRLCTKLQQEMVFYHCKFCHFIFVMIVLFFRFVNSLFYVGRVHLLTVSFSLWFGLFVCLDRTCLLFKQPMLSLKDKKNLHSTCGTFLPKEKTNFISLLHFAFGIYYWYQCLVSKWELTKSVLSTWNLNLMWFKKDCCEWRKHSIGFELCWWQIMKIPTTTTIQVTMGVGRSSSPKQRS